MRAVPSEKQLYRIAQMLRYDIIRMIGAGKVGHLGGSCSLAEIAAVLYFCRMRHDPSDPAMKGRDRFLLSKGHGALVQYAALAESGYFPMEKLDGLKELGSPLQGHPDGRKLPGIEANTGSLGQGLSIAAGMAAAYKLDGLGGKIFCVMGDGELAEGQIWEAAMSAAVYRLDNLVGIVDENGLQATGKLTSQYDTTPHKEKWEAFGWHVVLVDGHNVPSILAGLKEADQTQGKPTVMLCKTVKGKGIPFAEDQVGFHNSALTPEQYESALRRLREEIA